MVGDVDRELGTFCPQFGETSDCDRNQGTFCPQVGEPLIVAAFVAAFVAVAVRVGDASQGAQLTSCLETMDLETWQL